MAQAIARERPEGLAEPANKKLKGQENGAALPVFAPYGDYDTDFRKAGFRRGFLDTPFGQVHFVDNRKEGVPALVFLHQTPMSINECVEAMVLLGRYYRVLGYDYPGYGDSDKPETFCTIENLAQCAILLMDKQGIDKATFIGNHTGAVVAVELATGMHQSRVDRLVLVCPPNFDDEGMKTLGVKWKTWGKESNESNATRDMPPESGQHLVDIWRRRSRWVINSAINQRMLRDEMKASDCVWHAPNAISLYPINDRLPSVKAPTFVMWGGRDAELLDALGYKVSERKSLVCKAIPDSQEVDIPQGSPMMMTEMPYEFYTQVHQWLAAQFGKK